MPYDEAIAARVRRALARGDGIVERQMFGGLAFLQRGRIICCVMRGELLLRLGDVGAEKALRQPHARPVAFGHPINSMVWLAPPGFEADATLRAWLRRSLAFLATQPAAKTKRRKPRPGVRAKRKSR